MKRLYLMRHGNSLTLAEAGVSSDALRPLSEHGRRQVPDMALELSRRGARPALILHSPLLRAAQTARLAAEILKPALGAKSADFLDNSRPAEQVASSLKKHGTGCEELLAIGHQPQLGELVVLLAHELAEIRPGGIVALELGKPPRLLWSINPE